jgi:transposase InsO family protein
VQGRAATGPRIDRRPKIRFFDQPEESRLRAALNTRDAEMREARGTANAWRREREREMLPSLPHFGDHLTPAVLLSMNTELRRGELLALSSTRASLAFTVFERIFKEFGLPAAIRTDNGVPFASPNSLFGLSKLSVWWLRLGIEIERIQPAHPEQNGRHERMHLTLKKEATKPASKNFLKQQERFMHVFNDERPHQALGMKYPTELYVSSSRHLQGPIGPRVPFPRSHHHGE